jgi:hypothetical protein
MEILFRWDSEEKKVNILGRIDTVVCYLPINVAFVPIFSAR